MGYTKRETERTGAGGLNGERAKRLDNPNERRGWMKGKKTITRAQANCHIGTGKGRSGIGGEKRDRKRERMEIK